MEAVSTRTDVQRVVDWAKAPSGESDLSPEEILQRLNPGPNIRSERVLSCGAVKHLYAELSKGPVILGAYYAEQWDWKDTTIMMLTTGTGGYMGAKTSTFMSAKFAILGGPSTALAVWIGGMAIGAATGAGVGHYLISRRDRYQSWKLTHDFCNQQRFSDRQLQVGEFIHLIVDETDDDFTDFRGPVSLEPMHSPVDAPDGHTYERNTAVQWTQATGRSPKTNLVIPQADRAPLPVNYRFMAAMYARASWVVKKDLKELKQATQTLGQSSSDSLNLNEACCLFKFLHEQLLGHKQGCISKAYESAQSMFDQGHIDQAGLSQLNRRIRFLDEYSGRAEKPTGERVLLDDVDLSLTGINVTWVID